MKLQPPHSTVVDVAERDSAPWITMVHAATHDQRFFSSQVQAFQSDYRLLLIDLPGHGQSASLPGPYGFEEYAVSVLAAMDAAGVDQTHYLGSHTGAAVALILACRDGRRIQSMALESAPIPGLDLPSVIENYGRARAKRRAPSGSPAARGSRSSERIPCAAAPMRTGQWSRNFPHGHGWTLPRHSRWRRYWIGWIRSTVRC